MNPVQEAAVTELVKQAMNEWFQKGMEYQAQTNPFVLDNNAIDFAAHGLAGEIKQIVERKFP